jgi:hypothetical protein
MVPRESRGQVQKGTVSCSPRQGTYIYLYLFFSSKKKRKEKKKKDAGSLLKSIPGFCEMLNISCSTALSFARRNHAAFQLYSGRVLVRREAAGSRLSSSSAAGKYLCIARLS